MRKLKLLAAVALLLVGAACPSIPEAYVEADRATYAAVAPEYLRYVEADTNLDETKKERRRRTVTLWDFRIRKAGK